MTYHNHKATTLYFQFKSIQNLTPSKLLAFSLLLFISFFFKANGTKMSVIGSQELIDLFSSLQNHSFRSNSIRLIIIHKLVVTSVLNVLHYLDLLR